MTGYVALLHGVNVGGNRKVPMADLRVLLTELGHEQVATHLNSGNAVFQSNRTDSDAISEEIHQGLKNALSSDVKVQLRTASQMREIVSVNPVPEAAEEPSRFLVVFLDAALPEDWITGFDSEKFPNETVAHIGSTLYVWYRNGMGTSKLTLDALGKTVKAGGTGRNWNSVLKLTAMAQDREADQGR